MSRHIVDKTHGAKDSKRLSHYLTIERDAERNPLWTKMDRTRKGPKDASRVKQFLRVDRGYTT